MPRAIPLIDVDNCWRRRRSSWACVSEPFRCSRSLDAELVPVPEAGHGVDLRDAEDVESEVESAGDREPAVVVLPEDVDVPESEGEPVSMIQLVESSAPIV